MMLDLKVALTLGLDIGIPYRKCIFLLLIFIIYPN